MASVAKFRIEHVARTPRGWKVRTVSQDAHRARIAFPPGSRKKGSGRLVELLHPRGENPKQCKRPNPSELLILGVGNPATKPLTYEQVKAKQEKAIEFLDRIDADDPNGIRDMSVEEYADHKHLRIGEGKKIKAKGKSQKSKGKSNPKRRRNQEGGDVEKGKEFFREFHGKEPEAVRDLALKTEVQKTYVFIGDLSAARFLQDDGREIRINFANDKVKLAGSPDGKQLYCIGGNQNILPILKNLGLDTSKEFISIGRWYCVYYVASKSMTNFEPTEWEHYFGCVDEIRALMKQSEEKGWSNAEFQAAVEKVMKETPPLERDLPEAVYDKRNERILCAGGSYYGDWPGIIG